MPKLVIGSIKIGPNEKSSGFLPVGGIPEEFWPPVTVIRGEKSSPIVTVTGGIHGCEYSSIQAAKEITLELKPEDLGGTVIVSPIINVSGFFSRRAFLSPLDERNLNRYFPGNSEGTPSERLAHQVMQSLILPADFYLDLHGGDIVEALIPFTLYQPGPTTELEAKSKALAMHFGIPNIIRSRTSGSTYEAAVNIGKPSMIAEAGQQGILSTEAIELLKSGVYRVLNSLDCLTARAVDRMAALIVGDKKTKIRVFLEENWMKSPVSGMWYPAVSCGQNVYKGQTLGEISDFFGKNLTSVIAENDGTVVFLLTSLAVNQGDALLAVAHSEEA